MRPPNLVVIRLRIEQDILDALVELKPGKHFIDEDKATFYCAEYMGKLEEYGLVDMFRTLHPHAREFSWFSNSKNGFRIEHIFASESFRERLLDCSYVHYPREEKISDLSAMIVNIEGCEQ